MSNLMNLSMKKGQAGKFFMDCKGNQYFLCFKTVEGVRKIAKIHVPDNFVFQGEITLSEKIDDAKDIPRNNKLKFPIDISCADRVCFLLNQFKEIPIDDQLYQLIQNISNKSENDVLSTGSVLSQIIAERTEFPKKQLSYSRK